MGGGIMAFPGLKISFAKATSGFGDCALPYIFTVSGLSSPQRQLDSETETGKN